MLLATLLFGLALLGRDTPTLTATPAQSPITVDGSLSEQDWEAAPRATDFQQAEPVEGAPASQRTEIRVLYGDDALYVGARMFDTKASSIQRTLGRRDDINQADWILVAIDGYLDRKTALTFGVNAAGIQADGVITNNDLDLSWDAVWSSAVSVDEDGWTAEMRIPYSMLRFSSAAVQTWGINFRRIIPRTAEVAEWALVLREDQGRGLVAGFGTLEGLRGIRPRRNVQVTPYVVGSARLDDARRNLPAAAYSTDAGVDAKIGLAPNVTLALTVNPDFGQVESDPATLNLSAFETVFDERRPFFVEGLEIFDLGDRDSKVLYTRRIGADAPIIGAAKLTGRTERGLSFGVLGATTGEAFAPGRAYGVARARQTLGRDSRAGIIGTYFDASPGGTSTRRALTALADWDLRFMRNTHAVRGNVGLSHRRPDGAPQATGFSSSITVERISGLWQWRLGASVTDPHYNLNDLGRLRRNDLYRFSGGFSHEINGGAPFGPFQRASLSLGAGNPFTFREGRNLGFGFRFGADFMTRNFQEIDAMVFTDYLFGGYDPYQTRGLGPRARPREVGLRLSFETDERRTWTVEPSGHAQLDGDGGRAYEIGLEVNALVSSAVKVGAEIEVGREDGRIDWVANESFRAAETRWEIGRRAASPDRLGDEFEPFDDDGALAALLTGVAPYDASGAFYRPVYGARDGHTLDLSVRTTATFTPDLSLQVFGQLFTARGRYRGFRLLATPDHLAAFDAYPKRQAYQLASVQLNAVLRWQYRPGSTLFVVWAHARDQELRQDPFDQNEPFLYDTTMRDQVGELFGLFPTNVFVFKLNYTLLR